jgi:hypothetical protein
MMRAGPPTSWRGVLCRPVLAAEEAIIKLFMKLDSLYTWSEKSRHPDQFVKLNDSIVDAIESADPDQEQDEQRANLLRDGQHIIRQLRTGLGPRTVFCRTLPPAASKNISTDVLAVQVRSLSIVILVILYIEAHALALWTLGSSLRRQVLRLLAPAES